jgi:hypothetical protein
MTSQFKFDSNSGAFAVLSCTWSPTAANYQGASAALNPKVTVDALGTTICRTGSTRSARRASITAAEKRLNAAAYGYTEPLCRHEVCPYCSSEPSTARRCGTGS